MLRHEENPLLHHRPRPGACQPLLPDHQYPAPAPSAGGGGGRLRCPPLVLPGLSRSFGAGAQGPPRFRRPAARQPASTGRGNAARLSGFLPERARRVAEETASLSRDGITLVAADIPPAAFAAARAAGIPSVGISNFSWDWIYEGLAAGHPGYDDVLASMREDYRCADLLLRLPFHGEFPAFRRIEDTPLVARRAVLPPAEVRRRLEIPGGDPDRAALLRRLRPAGVRFQCPGAAGRLGFSGGTGTGWDGAEPAGHSGRGLSLSRPGARR